MLDTNLNVWIAKILWIANNYNPYNQYQKN